jgi:hypothetical protein
MTSSVLILKLETLRFKSSCKCHSWGAQSQTQSKLPLLLFLCHLFIKHGLLPKWSPSSKMAVLKTLKIVSSSHICSFALTTKMAWETLLIRVITIRSFIGRMLWVLDLAWASLLLQLSMTLPLTLMIQKIEQELWEPMQFLKVVSTLQQHL